MDGRKREREEQGRIQEERRKEQWDSIWRRELIAEDRKRAAELGQELVSMLEASFDRGGTEEQGGGLRRDPGDG